MKQPTEFNKEVSQENLKDIIISLGGESKYQEQGNKFLELTETTFNAEFLKHGKHFDDDKETRDIYKITLTRGERVFSFDFGQSINASGKYVTYPGHNKVMKKPIYGFGNVKGRDWDINKDYSEPNAYDVLTCLQKYDVGTLENFCSEFGYDEDSRKAEKIYKAVLNEYNNMKMLYSDQELEALQEVS